MTMLENPPDTQPAETGLDVAEHLRLTDTYAAHNYAPLPMVTATAEGPGSPTSPGGVTWTSSPPTRR